MDFGYTPDQEGLRQEVIDWIAVNVTEETVAEMRSGEDGRETGSRRGRGPLVSALFKKIGEQGWLGITWPKKYGGQEGDRMSQYIVEEEFSRAGIQVGGGGSGAPGRNRTRRHHCSIQFLSYRQFGPHHQPACRADFNGTMRRTCCETPPSA